MEHPARWWLHASASGLSSSRGDARDAQCSNECKNEPRSAAPRDARPRGRTRRLVIPHAGSVRHQVRPWAGPWTTGDSFDRPPRGLARPGWFRHHPDVSTRTEDAPQKRRLVRSSPSTPEPEVEPEGSADALALWADAAQPVGADNRWWAHADHPASTAMSVSSTTQRAAAGARIAGPARDELTAAMGAESVRRDLDVDRKLRPLRAANSTPRCRDASPLRRCRLRIGAHSVGEDRPSDAVAQACR